MTRVSFFRGEKTNKKRKRQERKNKLKTRENFVVGGRGGKRNDSCLKTNSKGTRDIF